MLTRWRTAALVTLFALIAVSLSACNGGGKPSTAVSAIEASQRGTYAVGVSTLHLVDASRETEANGDIPATSDRKLTTEVWYPADGDASQDELRDAGLASGDAPYPLVIFAHGLGSFRLQSASFARHLASHGYIVASPDFPSSNLGTPGGARLIAVLQQGKDVSFVIDSLLEANGEDGNRFQDAIDEDKIGMSGHSLGAMTTLLTIYGPDRDERIKAALPFSTVGCFFGDSFAGDVSVPIMAVGGTNDLITPPQSSDRAYTIANAPRYLVHVKGGDHVRFADVDLSDVEFNSTGGIGAAFGDQIVQDSLATAEVLGGNAASCLSQPNPADPPITGDRQRELMRVVGLTFFEAYLRDDKAQREAIETLPEQLPELTIQSDP